MEANVNQCWMKAQRKRCAKIPSVSLYLHYTSFLLNVEVISEVLFCLKYQKP